jgi:hypothetical protein
VSTLHYPVPNPGASLTTLVCSLNAPTEIVKQIIVNIEAGVEVEVTIAA